MKKFLLLFFFCTNVFAAGSAGLNFETYAAGGATPSTTNRTLLTTGTVPTINFNWGSGQVLNSGRSDGVIVHFFGYIKNDSSETATFGMTADDGIRLSINGTAVINSWQEDGGSLRSGSYTMTAGQAYYVDIWYYENGGGALVNFYWVKNSSWTIIPSTNLATDSSYWAPVLCCGGSSSSFSISPAKVTKINAFVTRSTADNQITIEQIGNQNNTTVQQTGTKNNKAEVHIHGSSNNASITQSGNSNTVANYSELWIIGDANTATIIQNSTGGTKSAFVTENNNNNSVTVQQKDNGSHYAVVNVSGGNKTVNITQQGSASHMANVSLSGQPISLSLTQSGATQQFYSITSNCTTSGGCAPITVTQGQ